MAKTEKGTTRPPIGKLVDLFSEDFGKLAPALVAAVRANIALDMEPRAAVNLAMAKLGVQQVITDSILDKLVAAAAIGFGVEPTTVADPIGIRRTFMNHHWDGDKLTLSQRVEKAEYGQVIRSSIESQMQKGNGWQKAAEKLSDPLRKGGGPDFIQAEMAGKLSKLATMAKTFAPDSPEQVRAFQGTVASAKKYVARLSQNNAPNQTLKTIYGDIIRAAEALKLKALDKAIEQAIRDKARYNAERIARTEMARAYGAAVDLRMLNDTDIIAERIMLSTRHPKPDICNFHTSADLYGMGPGVYPKNRKPPYPFHPHCLCVKVEVYEGEVELNEKMNPVAGERYLQKLPAKDRAALMGIDGAESFDSNPKSWQTHLRSWEGHKPVQTVPGLKPEMFDANKTPAPAVPLVDPATFSLRHTEASIRAQRFESAAAYDAEGNRVLFKNGNSDSVSFTPEEVGKLKGTVFTHNHPAGWKYAESDPRRGGNSFSLADVQIASKSGVKELRAVSPLFDHIMKPGPEGWDFEFFKSKIFPEYQKQNHALQMRTLNSIQKGEITIEQAEADHYHKVWTLVSEKLGLVYKREKAPE